MIVSVRHTYINHSSTVESRALKNVEPKNVQPEILRTPQPKAKNGGAGFLAACGIHMIQCGLLLRTCYKNAARLLTNKNVPG